jgi:hypothetical protein
MRKSRCERTKMHRSDNWSMKRKSREKGMNAESMSWNYTSNVSYVSLTIPE